MSDYDIRYGKGFDDISSLSRELQGCICAGCGQEFEPNELQFHHFHYQDEFGPLGDRIIPGVDGVSLHGSKQDVNSCHWRVHRKDAWEYDEEDPVNGNHNKPEIIERLQNNFASITGIDPRQSRNLVLSQINRKIPEHKGLLRVTEAWNQDIPTTPTQIGSQHPPEQYYEHDGELINAPVAGNISEGYEPSKKYLARLDNLADLIAASKHRKQIVYLLDEFKLALGDWFLPVLGFIAFVLAVLIST